MAGIPDQIKALILEYNPIFQEPSSLPPSRQYDLSIALLPNSSPVNTRSYRYSPDQKDEIERQVSAMLKSGIVVARLNLLPLLCKWLRRSMGIGGFVWITGGSTILYS
jgi:hypothetical protein